MSRRWVSRDVGELGACLGGSDRGEGADAPVVVAELGLRLVLDGLAVLDDFGEDASPGSDGGRCPRYVKPPSLCDGWLLNVWLDQEAEKLLSKMRRHVM